MFHPPRLRSKHNDPDRGARFAHLWHFWRGITEENMAAIEEAAASMDSQDRKKRDIVGGPGSPG